MGRRVDDGQRAMFCQTFDPSLCECLFWINEDIPDVMPVTVLQSRKPRAESIIPDSGGDPSVDGRAEAPRIGLQTAAALSDRKIAVSDVICPHHPGWIAGH